MKKLLFIILSTFILTACDGSQKQTLVSHYGDVLLTKNNELQFRFKFNEKIFTQKDVYKIKVLIKDKQLAKALGTTEIFYGEENVYKGMLVEVDKKEDLYISMNPIPLQVDLHTFVLKEIIQQKEAVKVEIYNDHNLIGWGYIENFHTQL